MNWLFVPALDACLWKCSPYIFHLIYSAHWIVDLAAIVCVLCLPGSGRWVCNLIDGILMSSQSDGHENLWKRQIMSIRTWYRNIPMVVAYQSLNAIYSRKKLESIHFDSQNLNFWVTYLLWIMAERMIISLLWGVTLNNLNFYTCFIIMR